MKNFLFVLSDVALPFFGSHGVFLERVLSLRLWPLLTVNLALGMLIDPKLAVRIVSNTLVGFVM